MKAKHTIKEKVTATIIVLLAFIILWFAIIIPTFETIFGIISVLFIVSSFVYMFTHSRNKQLTLSKRLILKLLFCLTIAICMIFNVFSSYTEKVAEHLLEAYLLT